MGSKRFSMAPIKFLMESLEGKEHAMVSKK